MPPKLHMSSTKQSQDEYLQEPPFCLQVEFVEGCSLRCSFCGLNGIRGKQNDFKFMSIETADAIISQLKEAGWKPRIEFAMHGEPSYHPQLPVMLAGFRRKLPKSTHMMMTSNGGGFLKDPTTLIDTALKYLNVLALDWYEGVKIVPKILEQYLGNYKPRYYPQDLDANPHHRRKPDDHDFVIVQDIEVATKGTHSTLNNHCGCGSPKNDNVAGKRCAKPFREMSIRWDGSIALCCNDWRGIFKCGNIHDSPLYEIWNNAEFQAARRKLIHGERDFGPCQGCDALSYRTGLLPDKFGKVKLPHASQKDHDIIKVACKGKSYTLPILRPWEQASPSS